MHATTHSTLRRRAALLFGTCLLAAGSAGAQISLNALATPVTENFDTLATSGTTNPWTDNSVILGWYAAQTAGTLSTYRASDGTSNAGGIHSFGTGTNAERALGSIGSGTPQNLVYAARLVNNTGATLTSLDVAYTGEQWRNGGNTTAHKLDFQYQIANAGVITGANIPATGWIDVNALDFTGPIATATAAALDGNLGANQAALSSSIALSANAGQEIWIRWFDTNDGGNDHGLAIDDLTITPQGTLPPPDLNIDDVTVTEGNAGTVTASFTVSLSAPAPAGGVTFDIATADNTATVLDNDYVAQSLTGQTIAAGASTFTFDVVVNGDLNVESDENFSVIVNNVTGATVIDGQGIGTITNDDFPPDLSIDDVTVTEGNAGTVTASFTVSLSTPAPAGGVTFDIATADGTATVADNDYVMQSLSGQTIAAGNSSFTFDVTVNGDIVVEANEAFTVNVSNATGATVADGQGVGTINNDDTASDLSVAVIAAPDPVMPGDTLTYTVNGSNAGPDAATNAQVALTFATEFASLSGPAGWSCTTPAIGAAGTVACSIASLPVGGFTFSVQTTVPSSTAPGALTANAFIGADNSDPTPANNTNSAVVTVVAAPSLPVVPVPLLHGQLALWLAALFLGLGLVAVTRRSL